MEAQKERKPVRTSIKDQSVEKGNKVISVKVKLPERLHRHVKAIGVLKGQTIQEVVVSALEEWIVTQDIKGLI